MYLFVASTITRECPWRDVHAMGAFHRQSMYRARYSDENILSLTCSPVPEILYYNRPGVLFRGELSLCEVRTHMSTGRLFVTFRIDCTKNYTCIMFVMVHLGSLHFALVYNI